MNNPKNEAKLLLEIDILKERILELENQSIRNEITNGELFIYKNNSKKNENINNELNLSSLFSLIDDLVFILDKDDKFLSYYAPNEKLLLKPEEFLNKKLSDVMPEEAYKKIKVGLDKTKEGKTAEVEYSLEMPDGVHYYSTKISPLFDEDKYKGSVSISRDITNKKRIEEINKINNERYKGVVSNAASCIAIYQAIDNGKNFKFTLFNPMAEKVEKITQEEVLGKKVTDVFPGVVEFGLLKIFQEVYKTGKPEHHPVSIYNDDRIIGYRENYVYKLSTGEIVAVYQDHTERKKANELLKESEAKYSALFNNINVALALHEIITDENNKPIDFVFLDANEAYEKTILLKCNEIIGKTGLEVIPNLEQKWIDIYGKVAQTGEAITLIDHSDYLNKYWEIKAYSPKKNQFAVALTDITDHREARLRLAESELKFRLLADYTYDWEYWIDENRQYVYLSPSCERMTGYSPEEFKKTPDLLYNLVKPDYKEIVHKHYHDETLENVKVFSMEFPILARNGKETWIEHHCTSVFDEKGNYKGRRGNNRDITDRKQAENALKKSEQQYRNFYEKNISGVYLSTIEGTLIDCNPAFADMLGYSATEILKMNTTKLYPKPTNKSEFLDNLTKNKSLINSEIDLVKKDGQIINCVENVVGTYNTKGELIHFQGYIIDVTEQKKAEEQLMKHQQHLEELVKERTSELEANNAELERLNNLFVGREFRIKELRDKLKGMKNDSSDLEGTSKG